MLDFKFEFDDFLELICARRLNDFPYGGVINLAKFELPKAGQSIRLMSDIGKFSSCALLLRIAEQAIIKKAIITTLRVGKKQADALETLNIPDVHIVCGNIMNETNGKYGQMEYLLDKAKNNGWNVVCAKNHSKIILLDTDCGKICIETSSNFNENPKIEQFCVLNSDKVYDWYCDELHNLGIL